MRFKKNTGRNKALYRAKKGQKKTQKCKFGPTFAIKNMMSDIKKLKKTIETKSDVIQKDGASRAERTNPRTQAGMT